MMKKRNFLAFLLLSAVQIAYAAPVRQFSAAQTAKRFFAAKGKILASANAAYAPHNKTKLAAKDVAPYFVFNAGANNGFVIVSGDDRMQPILGYVDSGSFEISKMPAHMRDFLNTYAEKVAELDSENQKIGDSHSENANQTRKAVRPLLKCLWNQGDPYSLVCPKKSGKQTPTGCVATAMAQVMYYYQWPAKTTKEIPAYTVQGGNGHYSGSIDKVDANASIDWANLKEVKYTRYSTDDQKKAISNLMAYVGRSVSMTYDYEENGGSGAYPSVIAPALNEYFNYSAKFLDRSTVTAKEFEDAVYNEIANNRPVIFNGAKASGGGGHCFVLDGYDGEGLYHVNWGWGGFANGYFAIPILDPDSNEGIGSGTGKGGFSTQQSVIIGIGRGVQAENPSNRAITMISGTYNSSIYAYVAHFSTKAENIEYTIGVREENATTAPVIKSKVAKNLVKPFYYSPKERFELKDLEAGKKYRAYVLTRFEGAQSWTWDDYNFAEVTVSDNGEIKVAYKKNYVQSRSLKVTKIEVPELNIVNAEQTAKITIKNTAGREYNGILSLAISKQSSLYGTRYGFVSAVPACLQPGEEKVFDLTYLFGKSGKQTLYVVDGQNYEISKHEVTVDAEVENSSVESSFEFKDNKTTIIGDEISGNAVLTTKASGFKSGLMLALLVKTYNGTFIYKSINMNVNLAANSSEKIPFDFKNVEPGRYTLTFLRYDSQQNSLVYFGTNNKQVTVQQPVVTYKNDGTKQFVAYEKDMTFGKDVVAVDFTGTYPSSVKKGENPNTLYYAKTKNIPGLEGANVVWVGYNRTTAEKIVLDDNHSFGCPIPFTAKQVTYTRQFKTAYANGKGWETITLPFDVQKVAVGDETIDWYKNKKDTGKDFWLMSYDGQQDDNVYFRYASDFFSNTPYIMAVPEKMKDQNIVFSATDAEFEAREYSVTQGPEYSYYGTFAEKNVPEAYTLNVTGDKFEKLNTPVKAFRGYFTGKGAAASLKLAAIGYDATGIDNITVDGTFVAPQPVFDLQGRRIATITNVSELNNLPKGVYVVKGKKMVVK